MKRTPLKRKTPLRKRSKRAPKVMARDRRFYNACWTRDDWKCQVCGEIADDVHHLWHKGAFPEWRWVLENGVSLCRVHHSQAEADLYYLNQFGIDRDAVRDDFMQNIGTIID